MEAWSDGELAELTGVAITADNKRKFTLYGSPDIAPEVGDGIKMKFDDIDISKCSVMPDGADRASLKPQLTGFADDSVTFAMEVDKTSLGSSSDHHYLTVRYKLPVLDFILISIVGDELGAGPKVTGGDGEYTFRGRVRVWDKDGPNSDKLFCDTTKDVTVTVNQGTS
jgi:hypothetical protein